MNTTNPYRAEADRLRAIADKLHQPSAHDEAMRNAFPLGAGFGHGSQRSRDRKMDAYINRATKAVQAERKAAQAERMADAWDRGERFTPQGRREDPARAERAAKRKAQQEAKEQRIAEAKAIVAALPRWKVTPETWATAHGHLAGGSRTLVMADQADYIAMEPEPSDIFSTLGRIFQP
jgi:hypothetical protein